MLTKCPDCDGSGETAASLEYGVRHHKIPPPELWCPRCAGEGRIEIDENDEAEPRECRRCAECQGSRHHWMHGEVPFRDDGSPVAEYGCKHCPALGNPCGCLDPELLEALADPDCPLCRGEGIVFAGVRDDEGDDDPHARDCNPDHSEIP